MIGIGLAASGHFPYAIKYNGAMALGNLSFAILMRNEVFGRILYLFVNTFFAKVRRMLEALVPRVDHVLVDTTLVAARLYLCPAGQ